MSEVARPPMLRTRLSLMMFLQYAIWGAWLPILYPFLLGHRGFSLDQVGAILAAGAAGAIVGPFIAGQIADRHFSTERFLAVSHLIGAGLVFALSTIDMFWAFLAVSIFYGIVYAPTLALTNSLSFHHLPNRDRDFGPVRVWGTIGWIAAGILVGQWLAAQHSPAELREALSAARAALEQITAASGNPAGAQATLDGATAALGDAQNAGRADAFRLSAILGVVMGFYCLTLPRTPPARNTGSENATVEAIKECKRQPLLMLFLIAVPVSIVHQFYFVHTADFLTLIQNRTGDTGLADTINTVFGVGGGGLMTIGQMTEVAVIALIGLVSTKVGRKALLAIGLVAYTLRMALFAFMPEITAATGLPEIGVAIAGVALHGVCFGSFIFVAFMVVDEQTTPDVRASAQNLFNLVIVGIGIIVGSWFATSIVGNAATTVVEGGPDIVDYRLLFGIPMAIAAACLLALLVGYPSKATPIEPARSDPARSEPGGEAG